MDIHAELITEEDATRLMEFDALFIRTTTSLNHYTFRLSQLARQNGMVVIDDPLSIIRCTNKVFLNELFEKEKIPAPLDADIQVKRKYIRTDQQTSWDHRSS